ncbi:MAG: AraC family transcriptional regulator [Eubacteriales bacterium]|nr:AraC family transcriptional regulator [Eubacteriales bacterium]
MKHRSKSLVKTRLFLSYSLAFILLLSVVFLFGYGAFTQVVIQNKLNSHETISRQMSAEIASRFERPRKIAAQFNLSNWVQRMLYMQKYPTQFENAMDALEVRTQSQQIKLMEVSAGFDEQIVLYFTLIDMAISNYGRSTWQDYSNYYDLQGPQATTIDTATLTKNHQQTLLPDCSMRINGKLKNGFVFLQTIPMDDIHGSNALLFYFMSVDSLTDQAKSYYHQKDVALYLMTANGEVTALSDAKDVEAARLFSLAQGNENCVYDRESDAYAMTLPLSLTGNQLLVLLPASSFAEDTLAAAGTFALIYAAVLLIALFFSNLLAKWGYRPLQKLVTNISVDVRPNDQKQETKDEYAMVELAMRSLMQQKERLDQLNSQQTPMAQRYLLLQAIHKTNDGSEEELGKALQTVLPWQHYCCAVLNNAPQNVQEGLERCFDPIERIAYIDVALSSGRLIVVGYNDPEILSALWKQAGEWAKEHSAYWGWSDDQTDLADFHKAYQQSALASRYHYLMPERNFIRFAEVRSRQANHVALLASDCAGLKYEMKQGNAAQANHEMILLSQLLVDVKYINVDDYLSAMDALGQQLQAQLQEGREEYPVRAMPQAGLFADKNEFMQAACQWLQEQLRNVERVASNEVLIVDYIRDHLTDPSLSQAQVAEALGYTPSYFSRYFKERFQQNYHQYVTERRIQLAKRLMDEGAYAVADLAGMTGFTSDASFRRVFKAVEGIPPSQYQQRRGANG